MKMYFATMAEINMVSQLINRFLRYKKIPINRVIDFVYFHINSFGEDLLSPEEQKMVDRLLPLIVLYRKSVAKRNSNLNLVTVDIRLFNEKMKELSTLLDKLKPIINDAYPNNKVVMKYLYITDKIKFKKGTEEKQITFLEGWLERIASKSLAPEALILATNWVEELKELLSIKEYKKGDVKYDRVNISDLKDQIFSALRKNYGELLVINSDDIRQLLKRFNIKLFAPNASDPKKLAKNQLILKATAGAIASAVYKALVKGTKIVFDNRKNDCDAIVFLSINETNIVPDYAQIVPKNSIDEFLTPDIGTRKCKRINVKLNDDTKGVEMKVTVKKIKKKKKE